MDNKFNRLCVLKGVILGDLTEDGFEQFFRDKINVRIKFAEEIISNEIILPELNEKRPDILFYIHDEDIEKFEPQRLFLEIKWWKDVIKNNKGIQLYPQEVLDKYPV
jgi:hypothetical protein